MRGIFFVLFVVGLLTAAVVDVGGGTDSHQVVVQTGETTTVVNTTTEKPSLGFVNENEEQVAIQSGSRMQTKNAAQVKAVEITPSSVLADGTQVQVQEMVTVKAANTNMVIVQEQNRVLVSDAAASAEVKTQLKYEEQAMVSTKSNKEIKVVPSVAVKAIPTAAEVKSIALTDDGTVPAYEVSAVSSGKMFFVFPMQMEITYKIDATNGQVISEEKPWWGFLVWS